MKEKSSNGGGIKGRKEWEWYEKGKKKEEINGKIKSFKKFGNNDTQNYVEMQRLLYKSKKVKNARKTKNKNGRKS